jgi:tripartite-type tricarboxylate transporter receptor subunit TctC
LAIKAAIPTKTVAEFVRYAKTNKISYGSSGAGSNAHLSGALFLSRAGVDAVHVPFRGGGPAVAALLGGQIDMLFGNAADIIPHTNNDQIRILAVGTLDRLAQLPDVPTMEESYPNSSFPAWNGFLAPTGTPQSVVATLAQHVISIAREPAIVEQLNKLGIDPKGTTPEEFSALIKKEQPQLDEAIKAAQLSTQ